MVNSYICNNCHHRFTADDADPQGVSCIHCGSDNISVVQGKSGMNPWILKGAAFLALVAVGFALAVFLKNGKKTNPEVESEPLPTAECSCGCGCMEAQCETGETRCCKECTCQTCSEKQDPIIYCSCGCGCEESTCVEKEGKCCAKCKHTDVILYVIANAGNPVLVDKKAPCKYSVTARAEGNLEGVSYHFILTPFNTPEKIVAKAGQDGKFTDVPASKTGSYDLLVVSDTKGKKIKAEVHTIAGFDVIPDGGDDHGKKPTPLTTSQVESLINAKDGTAISKNKMIAGSVRISVANPDPDESVPSSLVDAIQYLKMGVWTRVSVTNVNYNDLNQVNSVTLSVSR